LKYKESEHETLNLCISYRTLSIIVLTIVYILIWNKDITYSKILIVLGMILSSSVGTYLYKNNYPNNNNVIILTIIMESLAYIVFIILSGGISSPYLWYFINLLIIIMALKPFAIYSNMVSASLMLLMLVSVVIPKKIGSVSNLENLVYSDINTVLAFVVVSIGFYLLLKSYDKLLQGRTKLYELNKNLEKSKKCSDHALRHTMNVYDALNLFSLSNPCKVMDELNSTLYRTIAKSGCALFKLNSLCDIDYYSHEGITIGHENTMAKFILDALKLGSHDSLPSDIKIKDELYSIEYIKNTSNILAVLFMKMTSENINENDQEHYQVERKFYLHFVKVIMQELDIQSMVEFYIKSEEQNRIACEIHDTVVQKLFSISLNVSNLNSNIVDTPIEDTKTSLKNILATTNSTMKTLREAIYGIRWDLTEEESFQHKLTTYIQEAVDMNNTHISFDLDKDLSSLTSNKKTALYRIICESINNAIKHGKATEIIIDVDVNEGFVTGSIKDNGKGFDKKTIAKDRQGIRNMYMLTGVLKGTLCINSEKGTGTNISCKIQFN